MIQGTTITKEFKFEAAHRLMGHTGKCRHIHGHSYRALFTIRLINSECDLLDEALGVVCDFQVVKDTIGKWIQENLDHNYIANHEDPVLMALTENFERPFYKMKVNPTAENIAYELFHIGNKLIQKYHKDLRVVQVTIFETETSNATYASKNY